MLRHRKRCVIQGVLVRALPWDTLHSQKTVAAPWDHDESEAAEEDESKLEKAAKSIFSIPSTSTRCMTPSSASPPISVPLLNSLKERVSIAATTSPITALARSGCVCAESASATWPQIGTMASSELGSGGRIRIMQASCVKICS